MAKVDKWGSQIAVKKKVSGNSVTYNNCARRGGNLREFYKSCKNCLHNKTGHFMKTPYFKW